MQLEFKKIFIHAQASFKQFFNSFSCSKPSQSHANAPSETQTMSTMDFQESMANHTNVSLDLAKHVVSTMSSETNVVFSPLSIQVVLGLIASGSKDPTLNQLLHFLKSKTKEELNSISSQLIGVVFADGEPLGGPRLSFATGVWIDQSLSLKASFKEIVDSVYKAACGRVDFQAKAVEVARQVNLWTQRETGGLVKEILPRGSVDASTRLVFTNAVYFRGAWKEKFEASQTKYSDFFLFTGGSVQVPYMTSRLKQYIRAFSGFKVLGLPYKHGQDNRKFSMYLFLPDAKDGLPSLVKKVCSKSGFLESHLPHQKVAVGDFRIPKFKISFTFEASDVLKGTGLVLPFSSDGLTDVVDSPIGRNLYVSSIFHNSSIEVNEEGTEAAAASAAVVMFKSVDVEERLNFVADHPFLFVIREDTTGVILFIGQVFNPLLN